ncbi:MAG: formate transporter FocA [Anaerolineae bacterium]|nr:formate transporter FocA [Anaerolineae bacterium]
MPAEMAERMEDVGVKKANMDALTMAVLAVLAGAFIALGAVLATTIATGAGALPYGVGRLLTGLVFCLGLILVVVAGAELFTGNNLIVMAWASGKVTVRALLRNWVIVYLGNFVGSVATAVVILVSRQYTFAGGELGRTALNIANAKVNLDFVQAIALGIMCNALVCLAVWLTLSARTTTDKILAILFPIGGFVAAGFEHSVANMYFIPIGLLIKSFDPDFVAGLGMADALGNLDWGTFLINNLLPVTIGNIIGGGVMVALVYWFVYRRPK